MNNQQSRKSVLSALLLSGFLLVFTVSCAAPDVSTTASKTAGTNRVAWPAGLPVYDHVVIVVEENKYYDEIIGNPAAPYINGTLRAEGANFTRAYAEEHHSQGNYFWFFSGSNHNVGFFDQVPNASNNPDYPFKASNLGYQLIKHGYGFKGYAQSLPAIGSTVNTSGAYARKHVPWISFENVPNGSSEATSSNLPFSSFPTVAGDFAKLPTVAFVIPDLEHDMHDGKPQDSIPRADTWLRENLDGYYQWAKSNNSLLILTFDEDGDRSGKFGLTDPASSNVDIQNRVVTIFAGAHIKKGDYAEGKGITHVNILRTLEAMYGLPKSGMQQVNAAKAGISDDYIVTDVFQTVK